MPDTPTATTLPERLLRVPGRTALFMLLWFVVTEADISALLIGIPVAFGAAALSVALHPKPITGMHLPGAVRFGSFFAVQSVLGGVDVALRALGPRLRLEPAIFTYPLRLGGSFPRVFFINTISMLPGTLSSRLTGETVEVHVLDASKAVLEDLARVEERVADLFGVQLPPHGDGDLP